MEASDAIVSDIGEHLRAELKRFHSGCCKGRDIDKGTSNTMWAVTDALISYYEDAIDPDLIKKHDEAAMNYIKDLLVKKIVRVIEFITSEEM